VDLSDRYTTAEIVPEINSTRRIIHLTIVLDTAIRGLSNDWQRRPERPRHTWLRTLEADLQPLNHGLNSAWRHSLKTENGGDRFSYAAAQDITWSVASILIKSGIEIGRNF